MSSLVSVLYSASERRLRAPWRIAVALGLYIALLIVVNAAPPLPALPRSAALWLRAPLQWLPASVGAVIGLWLLVRLIDRERLSAFGLRLNGDWIADFGFGLGAGLGVNALLLAVELLAGWTAVTGTMHSGIPGVPYLVAVASPLLMMVLVVLVQDPLLRGYTIRNCSEGLRRLGPRPAVVLGAALSVALVVVSYAVQGRARNAHPNAVAMLNLAAGTIMFAITYLLTGRLGMTMGLHTAWDFSQGNVFGFPLAGLDRAGTASLFVVRQSHDNVWTGPHTYGPIGGLMETLLFVVAIGAALVYVRLRYGRLRLAVEIAAHQPADTPDTADDTAAASAAASAPAGSRFSQPPATR